MTAHKVTSQLLDVNIYLIMVTY